jgi:hypothetical protein
LPGGAGEPASYAGESAGGAGPTPDERPFPCDSSVPDFEAHRGYSRCGVNGVWHRQRAVDCGESPASLPLIDGRGCNKDSDCGQGMICFCSEPTVCVRATCTSDSDCGAGFVCRGYSTAACDGPGLVPPDAFACQTPEDVCATAQDCQNGMRCGGDSGHFACDVLPTSPTCGRPFLVENLERFAPLCARSDWSETELDMELDAASSELRAQAAQAWARIGQMEHASVAAFARFTLQLLQLGAPAELVERATRAATDEAAHARLAFALASLCAGTNLGPGPLDVRGSLEQTSLCDVVRLAFREGCVGETVAALQVAEAAAGASSPRLRGLLARVASDEAEHAELAWRFLRWALQQEPALAAVVSEELTRAAAPSRLAADDAAALREFGLLSPAAQDAIRAAALREVIEPCVAALLEQGPKPATAALGSEGSGSNSPPLLDHVLRDQPL